MIQEYNVHRQVLFFYYSLVTKTCSFVFLVFSINKNRFFIIYENLTFVIIHIPCP
jgi:hypothetical protein